jgi:hypothetical protein
MLGYPATPGTPNSPHRDLKASSARALDFGASRAKQPRGRRDISERQATTPARPNAPPSCIYLPTPAGISTNL